MQESSSEYQVFFNIMNKDTLGWRAVGCLLFYVSVLNMSRESTLSHDTISGDKHVKEDALH